MRTLVRRGRASEELDAELRAHLEMAEADLRAEGMRAGEARAEARRRFGNLEVVRAETRDTWGFLRLERFLADMRFGLRIAIKRPVSAFVVVATLAICIAANTTVFSFVDAVLLRPLPYADPGALVLMFNAYPRNGSPSAPISIPDYFDRRAQCPSLEESAMVSGEMFNVAPAGLEPVRVGGYRVTASLFATLGVSPAMGRPFTAADDEEGAPPAVIVTHAFWRQSLGSDLGALGRDVAIDGVPHQLVGVMPEGFYLFHQRRQILVPFRATAAERSDESRTLIFPSMVGRLARGADTGGLEREMNAIIERNAQRLTNLADEWRASGFSGRAEYLVGRLNRGLRPTVLLLQAAVACVLLLGCLNVGNLLLNRVADRLRELAMRHALGAGRWRLSAQMMAENGSLAVAAGALGIALSIWGVAALRSMDPLGLRDPASLVLGGRVLGAGLGATAVALFVCGLFPAGLVARQNLAGLLHETGARTGSGRTLMRFREWMVATQVALAMLLLAAAGHTLAGLWRATHVDPGFSPGGVLTAELRLPASGYPGAAEQAVFAARVAEAASHIPGAWQAGLIYPMPFSNAAEVISFSIQGRASVAGEPQPEANYARTDAGTIGALGLRLRQGRWLERSDVAETEPVAVIDDKLAARYWPGANPIGAQITLDDLEGKDPVRWKRVVGVVGDIVRNDLLGTERRGLVYVPFAQDAVADLGIVVRARGDPMALAGALRREVAGLDDELPLSGVGTMDARIADSLDSQTTRTAVLGVFAAAAVLLAGLGVYGVMTQTVQAREHEIGVRRVLGATTGDVSRLVLGRGCRVLGVGVAAGIVGALSLSRVIPALVPDTVAVGLGGFAALLGIIVLSGAVPLLLALRRATRISPLRAMNAE